MFGGDDDFFGGLFDFDGNGKTSFEEAFLAHELFASDEELKLEYGDEDDKPVDDLFDDDDDDEELSDGSDDENEDSNNDECDESDSCTDVDGVSFPHITVNVGFEFPTAEERIKREDYPNERKFQAADRIDGIIHNPDIYDDEESNRREIEKCDFILNNPNITAANYLNIEYGFLFVQAVKERFRLPITLPEDDAEIHTSFPQLFKKVARHNPEYAVRLWHWCLTMFVPYIQYGDKNDVDELTGFILCDITSDQLSAVGKYAETHPHFTKELIYACTEIPCSVEEWIAQCINEGYLNTAKSVFEGFISKTSIEPDTKETFVSTVIEYCCREDDIRVIEYFRDKLYPSVIAHSDKPMRKKATEWESEMAEYIKECKENCEESAGEYDWRIGYDYVRRLGINPDDYESEEECNKAYQDACDNEQRKISERRHAELNHRTELCKSIENGGDLEQYTYCAVLLPSVPRPYHYKTNDGSIKIGDKVVVPVGEDNKEITGTVASIEIHTELTVPFPIDKTKSIIRRA